MTNQEYIIAALTDQIDDGGATWEACVHYNINCPYFEGDRRCHCYPEEYRDGTVDRVAFKDKKEATRELCVECKAEWLESEVDE